MKKSTTSRKTKTTRTSAPVPIGLVTMMQAIRIDGDTNYAAEKHARAVYPLARRILGNLHDGGLRSREELRVLDEAIHRIFPGIEEPNDAHTGAEAGFYVGVATAWLMMSRLQGGAR